MKQKIILWSALILLLIAVGFMVKDFFYKPLSTQGNPYEYSLDKFRTVDDSLICYKETGSIRLESESQSGIAIGQDDDLYVVGKDILFIYNKNLEKIYSIKTGVDARCVSVDSDKKIYLGISDHVEVWNLKGEKLGSWSPVNERAYITSIAVSESSVYVADAGNKMVYRFDKKGNLLNKIGEKNLEKGIPGFFVPSPFFDLLIGRDGELVVVNPGRHAFEFYRENGSLITSWERTSMGIDGFSGCCNPSNIAMLSDGSFVTAEKVIERVKIHSPNGDFKCVVAAPEKFQKGTQGIDLAVDSKDRIFVLDPVKKMVVVYELK